MNLFGKKKEEKKCCCSGNSDHKSITAANESKSSGARIKILGSGCAKCNELETNTVEALTQLKLDASLDHVTDFVDIASYGVMTTPALVADGKVISYGKVLSTDEIVKLLKKVL